MLDTTPAVRIKAGRFFRADAAVESVDVLVSDPGRGPELVRIERDPCRTDGTPLCTVTRRRPATAADFHAAGIEPPAGEEEAANGRRLR